MKIRENEKKISVKKERMTIISTMIPRATLACNRRGRGFILPYLFW